MRDEVGNGGWSPSMTVTVVGAAVGLGFIILLGCVFCSGSKKSAGRKTMKAPGRDGFISRAKFEGNPSKYFRELRKK